MGDPFVQLAKPSPRDIRKDEYFDRGERIITVDGVRWGRTVVTSHGVHGQKHRFRQDGHIDMIYADPNARHPREVEVWSRRRIQDSAERAKTTEDRVLEKARELVRTDKLRHPDVIAKEQEETRRRIAARQAEAARQEEADFHARACAALGVSINDHGEKVQAVIAAMRWAQSQ